MLGLLRFAKKALLRIKNLIPPSYYVHRVAIAKKYLRGKGIEIGALHGPLKVSKSLAVKYVDRLDLEELKRHYPELDSRNFVKPDLLDDGERLQKIPDSTQDFVIASHFLEHCQDPIKAMIHMMRVLREGGILFLVIPDKRYTFDRDRPVTPLEHLLKDHEEGPESSRAQHFEEWTRRVNKIKDDREAEKQIASLMEKDFSIHYHAWTQTEMLELILLLKKKLNFEAELFLKSEGEVVFVLRKGGRANQG